MIMFNIMNVLLVMGNDSSKALYDAAYSNNKNEVARLIAKGVVFSEYKAPVSKY